MESLIQDTIRKSRVPARLDFFQSATGLILGLFMWAHMCLVASIIIGKDAFYFVAKLMEASFLSPTGEGYPILVSFAAIGIFTLFIIHAALGVRKFPANWRQLKILKQHVIMLNHGDTTLWFIQFITGFIMFFLGSVHLYFMITHPSMIGPYASADRIISEWFWPLYLVLLFSVELHGTIGLYRLCVKWGWFDGKDPRKTRRKLQAFEKILSVVFILLGITALIVFSYIGIEHKDRVGQRYSPHYSAIK